jgi:hypothetical protein
MVSVCNKVLVAPQDAPVQVNLSNCAVQLPHPLPVEEKDPEVQETVTPQEVLEVLTVVLPDGVPQAHRYKGLAKKDRKKTAITIGIFFLDRAGDFSQVLGDSFKNLRPE